MPTIRPQGFGSASTHLWEKNGLLLTPAFLIQEVLECISGCRWSEIGLGTPWNLQCHPLPCPNAFLCLSRPCLSCSSVGFRVWHHGSHRLEGILYRIEDCETESTFILIDRPPLSLVS